MEYKRESLTVVPLNPASHIIRYGASRTPPGMDRCLVHKVDLDDIKISENSSFSTLSILEVGYFHLITFQHVATCFLHQRRSKEGHGRSSS